MPLYEYECGSCGRRFDQLQRMTDDPLAVDPQCGGPVRRVIQPVGIIFKGSGFYATDSRKASSASSNGSSDTSKSETKSETKSDTKSDSKTDSSSSSSSSDRSSESKPAAAAAS